MDDAQLPVWQLSDSELAALLLRREEAARSDYVERLGLVTEAENRGLAVNLGYRDTSTLLAEVLRISPHDARKRVGQASAVLDSTAVNGQPVTAPLPRTGAALAEGVIGAEHVTEIQKALSAVSGRIDAEQYAEAEANLVELARQANPAAVRTAGRHLLAYLDQDGKPPADEQAEQAEPHREFFSHTLRTGWLRFTGYLDPETAAQLTGMLGTLAKPEPADAAGRRDTRMRQHREGDALAEIIDLASRCDDLATQGGERAAMTITIGLTDLENRTESATLAAPGGTGPESLRRLACQARVVPAVLGTRGEILDLGRAARLASTAQRHALVLRDRGCAFPGCDRGPKWTTPHHITHWADGGATDQHNLVLLCARHHRRIHHTDWRVRIHHGRAEFTPPDWIAPDQTSVHNRAHEPPGYAHAA